MHHEAFFKHQLTMHCTDSDPSLPCKLAFTYVDRTLEQSTMLASWLSPAELETLNRRKQVAAKNEFIASRLLLKHLITRHYQAPYSELTILFNSLSKRLEVVHLAKQVPISCVISHSHGAVAAAVSSQPMPIGLDIEFTEKTRGFGKLAAHFYEQQEVNLINTAPVTSDCFYRIWTLKEALAKTIGEPIAKLLAKNVFDEINARNLIAMSGRCGSHDISVITAVPISKRVNKIPLSALIKFE